MQVKDNWEESNTQTFWGEIATTDHLVQIYDNDDLFVNMLSGFVTGGILAGESVIAIATEAHLRSLERNLKENGFDIFALTWRDQYIPVNANEALKKFMVNGWPNEKLFNEVALGLLTRAQKKGRKVRAFGEMVAILLEEGQYGATVNLEHLWNKLAAKEDFCLYCGYPRSAFRQNPNATILHICSAHTKIIAATGVSTSNILYRETGVKF